MRKTARVGLSIAAVIFILTAAMLAVRTRLTQHSYEQLSQSAEQNTLKTSGIDWNMLREQNDELVGWLSVEGTPIDYPIVQTAGKTPVDFYLTHDFWRNPSLTGCPYLDERSVSGGTNLMVFGHQLWPSDQIFSSLRLASEEPEFRKIGVAHWKTPDGETSFEPLCALKVDETFAPIQRFAFSSQAELHTWLADLTNQASARAEDAEENTAEATRALTLITCASTISGSRERIVVVFTARDSATKPIPPRFR